MLLADAAPPPSWAGVITAFASLFTALALVISAAALWRKQRAIEEVAVSTKQVAVATYHMVDGNVTAMKVSELGAMEREVAALRMVAALQTAAGIETSPADAAVIAQCDARIAQLRTEIVERRAHDADGRARMAGAEE